MEKILGPVLNGLTVEGKMDNNPTVPFQQDCHDNHKKEGPRMAKKRNDSLCLAYQRAERSMVYQGSVLKDVQELVRWTLEGIFSVW